MSNMTIDQVTLFIFILASCVSAALISVYAITLYFVKKRNAILRKNAIQNAIDQIKMEEKDSATEEAAAR